jgi:predicted metal-dependent peptidase
VAPDIYLVADLLAFKDSMPEQVQHAARQLVANLVEQLLNRLRIPTQQSLRGSLSRASRNLRPKRHEIDWQRTVRANLKHYQPEYKTIIPRKLIGFGRQRPSLREVFLCVDQSGSMVTSVVYASVFGAVLASLPALKTNMIFFDHEVHDVTPHVEDPVEILFSANIGGGTNINQVVGYVQQRITRPEDSICVLITDLHEGGDADSLLRRVFRLVRSGVQVIVLLALTDTGTPSYHHGLAAHIAAFEVPVFACTPEHFPELMGAAINGDDIHLWAGREGFVTVRHDDPQG